MTPTTRVMHVLGDVREEREPAECAYHVDGDFGPDAVELLVERDKVVEAGPAMRDRVSSESLDEVEHPWAGLLGDDLSQQATQQPDVSIERIVGAGRPFIGRLGHGAHSDGVLRPLCELHASICDDPPSAGSWACVWSPAVDRVNVPLGRTPCSRSRRPSALLCRPDAAPEPNDRTCHEPQRATRPASAGQQRAGPAHPSLLAMLATLRLLGRRRPSRPGRVVVVRSMSGIAAPPHRSAPLSTHAPVFDRRSGRRDHSAILAAEHCVANGVRIDDNGSSAAGRASQPGTPRPGRRR